jgi:hypothetical protein
MATIAEIIKARMDVASKIAVEEAAFKDRMGPAYALQQRLETAVLAHLNENGIQNVKVDGVATAFKKRKVSVSVADWDVTWAWITKHERWDILNHAVNKTVVEAIHKDTGEIPPGVNYAAQVVVQFNRAPGAGEE